MCSIWNLEHTVLIVGTILGENWNWSFYPRLFLCYRFCGQKGPTVSSAHTYKHRHSHVWKRSCWLIQASSSRPTGGWSNPVIRPNRCCWQNNKRGGGNMAARLRGGHEPNSSQQQQDQWLAGASWTQYWSHTPAIAGRSPHCDTASVIVTCFLVCKFFLLCLQCQGSAEWCFLNRGQTPPT